MGPSPNPTTGRAVADRFGHRGCSSAGRSHQRTGLGARLISSYTALPRLEPAGLSCRAKRRAKEIAAAAAGGGTATAPLSDGAGRGFNLTRRALLAATFRGAPGAGVIAAFPAAAPVADRVTTPLATTRAVPPLGACGLVSAQLSTAVYGVPRLPSLIRATAAPAHRSSTKPPKRGG